LVIKVHFTVLARREVPISQSPPNIDDSNHDVSFLQVRGSIPLFWSQTPYSLKLKPTLERSADENAEAFAKHFDILLNAYEHTNSINLVESHGREAIIGTAFREAIQN
ncbi:9751_t:CDS:2, partial [Racocetra persica]